MSRTRRLAAVLAVSVLALALGACGDSASTSGSPSSGTITVFAAASLTEAFTTIGRQFEQAHPGTAVRFSFGPSSGLAEQIDQGAPADVFASADGDPMERVRLAGHVNRADGFASNTLEIAVPRGNPAHVSSLADLASPDVKVALCQPQVPCGALAARVLSRAGQVVHPVTLDTDVKAVLAAVSLGEVDAGIVYTTDVRAAGTAVEGVPLPSGTNASTVYPIAALSDAPHRAGANAFVQYVLSPAGRSVLLAAGFGPP
ncbi:MAG TPA: molybdate ABC transporter substrate-binding protein [Actinomycetales bacterium]|nr:molybdate ABC transporter substrate-binding protein [Actinomycetales bacterium]